MAGVMIRCSGLRDGARCYRRTRAIYPKGVVPLVPDAWTCSACVQGQPPFVPKDPTKKEPTKTVKKKK